MTRIYTEDVNRDAVVSILDQNLDGYTITPALGRYHGKDESSICIEVLDASPEKISRIAEEIKTVNHQDSVLVVNEQEEDKFL